MPEAARTSTSPTNSAQAKDQNQSKKSASDKTADSSRPNIVLNSPVGGKPAIFKYSSNSDEIIETIRWVSREYQEFKPAIENLLADYDAMTYEDVKEFCDRYNKITGYVIKMNKGTSIALKTSSRASQGLLKHIMHQVYNYAVVDPERLNQYTPFSSQVYGETSFDFVAQMIEDSRTRPQKNDIFIDLGSGVGQVALQVAASVDCKKCYGIEKSDVPAEFAILMEEKFRFWMDWFGKTYTEFELFHGDFFDDKFANVIKESTHLFINNFAFEPEVNHQLKLRFIDLIDGAKIISSKQFCPPRSRITERDLSDIGSLMHVIEIQPEQKKDTVSWTDKQVPYYLHTLDGTKVEKYYEKQKKRKEKPKDKLKDKEEIVNKGMKRKRAKSTDSTAEKPLKVKKLADNKKVSTKTKSKDNKLSKDPKEKTANRIKQEKNTETLSPKPRKRKVKSISTDTQSTDISISNMTTDIESKTASPTENVHPENSSSKQNSTKVLKRRRKAAGSSSLDFLHEKTVESNTVDFSQPAPGCIDQGLSKDAVNPSNLPNIIINDLTMFLSSRNMNKLFDNLRQEFEKFNEKLKRPNMRECLMREINKERERKRELMFAQESLSRNIKTLVDRANKAAGAHCEQIGIPNSSSSLVRQLGVLLSKHQELSRKEHHLLTYPIIPSRSQQPPSMMSHQVLHHMNPPAAHSQGKSTISSPYTTMQQTQMMGPQQPHNLAQTLPLNLLRSNDANNRPSKMAQSSLHQPYATQLTTAPSSFNPNSMTLDLSKKTSKR